MKHSRPALIATALIMATAAFGCDDGIPSGAEGGEDDAGSFEDSDGDTADEGDPAEPRFGTGCAPNLPPCACVLKGLPVCNDSDGDGILNLYDNCDWHANANQANCDGDFYGDACDAQSATTTFTTQLVDETSFLGVRECYAGYDDSPEYFTPYQHVSHYEKTRHTVGCGPDSNLNTEEVVDTWTVVTTVCWLENHTPCGSPRLGPPEPFPLC